MKLSLTQENLNHGLSIVSHIASKSTTLPILSNILIKANGGEVRLLATNLELGITCTIRGKVEEEGDFTVQSRLLADYVNLLPKERVDMEIKEDVSSQEMSVSCQNFKTKIKGLPATDFPLIPEVKKENAYICDANDLREGLGQVGLAVSISETRPEIGGVLFNFKKDKLVLTGTDSYRLAERYIKVVGGNSKELQVIVPAKTINEVQRILGGSKDPADINTQAGEVQIYITENQVVFSLGNIELTSRLVEGRYPDYTSIIPSQHNTRATMPVTELSKAIKSTSLFARTGIYDVGIEFKSEDGQLVVSSVNAQLGENISTLKGEVTGDSVKLVVNYRYLLDCLSTIGSEQVDLTLQDANSPLVIKPRGEEEGYLYLIMPIKQS